MSDEKLDFYICGTFRKEILERISDLEKKVEGIFKSIHGIEDDKCYGDVNEKMRIWKKIKLWYWNRWLRRWD